MTATAPLVVGLWLDGTPSRWEPLAAVALGDAGRTRMLLDEQAAADLLVVGEHPTTAAVAPEVLARLQDFTLAHVEDADLVVLGGYRGPDSVKNPYLHGELHGVVRLALHQAGIPAAVVRPALLSLCGRQRLRPPQGPRGGRRGVRRRRVPRRRGVVAVASRHGPGPPGRPRG